MRNDPWVLLNNPWELSRCEIQVKGRSVVILRDTDVVKIKESDLRGKLDIKSFGKILTEYSRCCDDFLYFLGKYVYTTDIESITSRYSKFPYTGDPEESPKNMLYFKELYDLVHDESVIYIEKSRRVMATWFILAYSVWMALFRPSSRIYLQSKNKDSSEYLIERCATIVTNLPDFLSHSYLRPGDIPITLNANNYLKALNKQTNRLYDQRIHSIEGVVRFPKSGSVIQALPGTPNAARGLSISMAFIDEAQDHPHLKKTLKAILPTAKQTFVVGTPERGTDWYYLLFPDPESRKTHLTTKLCEISRGVSFHKRERDIVIALHYSCNPTRQKGSQWYKEQRKKYDPEDFDQEFEISWEPKRDKASFSNFSDDHLCYDYEQVLSDLRENRATLYMSYDPGLNVSAMMWWAVYQEKPFTFGRIIKPFCKHVVFKVIECSDLVISQQAEIIYDVEREIGLSPYSRVGGHDLNKRSDQSGRTNRAEWAEHGIYFAPADTHRTAGHNKVQELLLNHSLEFVKDVDYVPAAIRNYVSGGDKKYSHTMDALRYGVMADWIYIPRAQIHPFHHQFPMERQEESAFIKLSTTRYDFGKLIH